MTRQLLVDRLIPRFLRQSKDLRRRAATPRRRALRLESLERRELLAVDLAAAVAFPVTDGGAQILDIVQDAGGNTYLAGGIESVGSGVGVPWVMIDLDPANVHPDSADLVTAPHGTGFIAKYDAAGNFQWVRAATEVDNGGSFMRIAGLDLGASGDLYFCGFFENVFEIGGVTLDSGADAAGNIDMNYLAGRLNPDGSFDWVAQGPVGTTDHQLARGLAVDESRGKLFLAIDADLPGNLSTDRVGMIAALQVSGGTTSWTATLDSSGAAFAKDVAVDSAGNVCAVGHFLGTADFNPGNGKLNLTSGNGATLPAAGYVWKLSTTGSLVWAKHFAAGSNATSTANSVAVDAANNVYVAGSFSGPVDFDPGKAKLNLASAGGRDAYLAKFNSAGTFAWAKSYGGSGDDTVSEIALDSAGNVYVTGQRPGSTSQAFVARFNPSGTLQWQHLMQSESVATNALLVDATGNVHVVGDFLGALNADGDPDAELLSSGPDAWTGLDGFWLRLSQS